MNYLCLSDKKMKTILIPTFEIKLVDKKSSPIISIDLEMSLEIEKKELKIKN